MIVAVAEVAFQRLQRDKELRPSVYELLDMLQKIEKGKNKPERPEVHGARISYRDTHTSANLTGLWSGLITKEFEGTSSAPNPLINEIVTLILYDSWCIIT